MKVTVVSGNKETWFEADAVDISETGIGLLSSRGLNAGETFTLTIHDLPVPPIRAIVRWSAANTAGTKHHIGLEFFAQSAQQRAGLVDAVERAVARSSEKKS